jgi:restriction endonuclease S subunit
MYLRGVDIKNGFIDGNSTLRTNLLIANSKNTVIKDDILVTRVGSIGVCALIENNHSGSFYSDNLIRIRLSDQVKEELKASYLNLLLNTTYGQMQMVRYSRGSVQQRLNQTQLAQIPVPIIKWETQLQIEDLIKRYRQAKKESKSLLDQAKTRVEQLIEEAVRR